MDNFNQRQMSLFQQNLLPTIQVQHCFQQLEVRGRPSKPYNGLQAGSSGRTTSDCRQVSNLMIIQIQIQIHIQIQIQIQIKVMAISTWWMTQPAAQRRDPLPGSSRARTSPEPETQNHYKSTTRKFSLIFCCMFCYNTVHRPSLHIIRKFSLLGRMFWYNMVPLPMNSKQEDFLIV